MYINISIYYNNSIYYSTTVLTEPDRNCYNFILYVIYMFK